MKNFIVVLIAALAACTNMQSTQNPAPTTSPTHPAMGHAKLAAVSDPATLTQGLADLDNMTFDCPKAGLNAAAREAAKVPSQGTYQFSYFKLVSDAHHASYEVHFRSNATDEPELRYCVSIYCQQGWDPKQTEVAVTPMSNSPGKRGENPESSCGMHAGKKGM
ncbi:MAG: hypothetical protein ACJ8MR_11365 [Povalibacter sp.]